MLTPYHMTTFSFIVSLDNWAASIAWAGGIVTIIALLGCFYLLRTLLIELHTACDDDYEWPH